ncbi:MAG TPA: choice-of-anchor tandem repeat GloVer-containing protein [Verrucomicrobiae bacterium]|nr:choice-of-anchor tandem repeat GloVer-containing protein [Verrucomicrobiae bacterium]
MRESHAANGHAIRSHITAVGLDRFSSRVLIFLIAAVLALPVVSLAADPASGATATDQATSPTHTIMHPDRATMLKWFQAHEAMPKPPMAAQEALLAPGGTLSLLSYLDYVPSQRNQGYCGDCWCWAGTGCMEILLDVQNGIFDRLSVQEANSCEPPINGVACCDGGWLSDVAMFYSASGYQRAVPWSNPGANWQDINGDCSTACSSITATPNYPIQSITANSITTYGVSQAQAIANIKAILNQNKPVAFAFFLSTQSDWDTFDSFWDNQPESTTINFDFACGQTYDQDNGGGHEVLCVGYNDTNPNDPYWILVNSWGTTPNRPNGIFHVCMTNNYNCTFNSGGTYQSYYWEYLNVTYTSPPKVSASPTSLSQTIAQGQNGTNQNFLVWNSGSGTLNYTISTNASWLSVSPTNGTSTGATNTHLAAFHTAGLAIGSYNAALTVSSTNAFNSQSITVSVTVSTGCTSTYTIATSSLPPGTGTTSGGGTYGCGSNATVCATPAACYQFVNWTDSGGHVLSTAACYTFTVASNQSVVANFSAAGPSTIATSSSPTAGGTTSGGGTYGCGSNATVCATPAACYQFVNWTDSGGHVLSATACYSFTVYSNQSLVAHFSLLGPYTIGTSNSPAVGGITSGGGIYPCGSNVTVCATPSSCYNFVNWTVNGTAVSTSLCYSFTPIASETLVASFAAMGNSGAAALTNLWTFTGGADGANPMLANLIQATDSCFYGTAAYGGANGYGAVIRITPAGVLTSLWSFANGTDGANPYAPLVQAGDGNFYGTTSGSGSGASPNGTVFRITSRGTLTTLRSFSGGSDGAAPYGGLVQGIDGNLYGTTSAGGTSGNGTVYRITTSGTLTTLRPFAGGSDGSAPYGGLVQGVDGNFYGTTSAGGASGNGIIYRITPSGTLTNLWSFSGGLDGGNPNAGLAWGGDGNLYGMTSVGGANGNGTVFRITPTGTLSNLCAFQGCLDGAAPYAALVQGSDGNFYGTTSGSGSGPSPYGTVFRITPAGTLTTLASFSNGLDGANPYAGLVQGVDGGFYGTTLGSGSGSSPNGSVFRLWVSLIPPANQVSKLQVQGANLILTIPSVAGETYQLQSIASLTLTNWTNIAGASLTNSIGGPLSLTNFGGASQPQGFYRFAITP